VANNKEIPMEGKLIPSVLRKVFKSDAPYSGGLHCGGGGCPAVYETDQGTYFVVGRRLSKEEKAKLSIDSIEDALEVPADLLLALTEKLRK
jgi:hypothetical protein